MDKVKGIKIVVEFGEIRASIENPDIDVDSMSVKDQVYLIRSTIKAAANEVIEVQKSLR